MFFVFIPILFVVVTQQFCFCLHPTPETGSLMNEISEIKKFVSYLEEKTKTLDNDSIPSLNTLLTTIDVNIRSLQEKAHLWDTFRLQVSTCNEQLSDLERKLDILNNAQRKLDDLDSKLNDLLNSMAKKIDDISSKTDLIEASIKEINNKLDDNVHDRSLIEEFTSKGILYTIKQVDKKIDKIQLNSFQRNETCFKLDQYDNSNNNNSNNNSNNILKSSISKEITEEIEFDYTFCNSFENLNGIFSFNTTLIENAATKYWKQRLCKEGWLVIQKRGSFDVQENFNRSWNDYKLGFGELDKEFWIGNDFLHDLSYKNKLRLRIELETFDDIKGWAEYDIFKVRNETEMYQLKVKGYNGTVTDSFSTHDNSKFSTFDKNNDNSPTNNGNRPCAIEYVGGWWFTSYTCLNAHLNGVYFKQADTNTFYGGLIWEHWLGIKSMRKSVMMVKPRRNLEKLNDLTYEAIVM